MCIGMECVCCYANVSHFLAGDGAKAVAKRKLQQTKLPVSKQAGKQGAEAQAEVSGSNEAEAASPVVLPKVCYLACRPLATQYANTCLHAVSDYFFATAAHNAIASCSCTVAICIVTIYTHLLHHLPLAQICVLHRRLQIWLGATAFCLLFCTSIHLSGKAY